VSLFTEILLLYHIYINFWKRICQILTTKTSVFAEWERDIILLTSMSTSRRTTLLGNGSVHSRKSSTSHGSPRIGRYENYTQRTKLPSSLVLLMYHLATEWSSFALNKTTFVKFLSPSTVNTFFYSILIVNLI
jgi:hypothetical protein